MRFFALLPRPSWPPCCMPGFRLEEEAGLVIEGDRERALAYADIFELPDKLA